MSLLDKVRNLLKVSKKEAPKITQQANPQLSKLMETLRQDPERLQRLKNMGADTSQIMVHGTREKNVLSEQPWEEFRQQTTFLSPDPGFSNFYARERVQGSTKGNRNIPVFPPQGNYFDFENPEHMSKLKADIYAMGPDLGPEKTQQALGTLKSLEKDPGNWLSLNELSDILKKSGYEGYYEKELNTKNLAVFDPTKIKSVWAKGRGPGLIGGAAGAALLAQPEQATAEQLNPLNQIGDIVNKYRGAQEQLANKIVETVNPYKKQQPDQTTQALGRMLIDPLNLVEGPVGYGLGALELLSNKEKQK